MARDCPDRQRGTDWRNNNGGFGRGPKAIGSGDAVDREMEQLMQELSGGAPGEEPPRRIEAGPDSGYDDRDMKPWQQRGPPPPPSDVAPWQQRGRDNRRDDYGSRDQGPPPWAAAQSRGGDYGYGGGAPGGGAPGGGYGAPPGGSGYGAPGAAPWQQQAPPPPPPGGQPGYGYGGYPGFPPGMSGVPGAPGAPGMGVPPPPPGMPPMHYGTGATPPPPPPPADGPPPPVSFSQ